MILERYIADPRHVEVQVFGDTHGNYVHLWEQDCSMQRWHQKIIEEAPAPGLDDETRQGLGNTAVNAARAVQYEGAGTVEFIYDRETADFYFMEMNTRLEPVTEAVTGQMDLAEWQFKVAKGKPLPIVNQWDIKLNGHALEGRIYAEEIDKTTFHFMPSAGVLEYLRFPTTQSMNDGCDSKAPYTRVDSGVQEGDCMSVHYDPMIAEIVGWAPTRTEAIKQLDKALGETHIGGLQNNVKLVKACLAPPQFVSGDVATDFIEKNKEQLVGTETSPTRQLPLRHLPPATTPTSKGKRQLPPATSPTRDNSHFDISHPRHLPPATSPTRDISHPRHLPPATSPTRFISHFDISHPMAN
ncbi:carbamoyl-phosphate synthase L chain, ATP binding domain-containing protein [Ditylenchus destructor]|uniref:Carbamoyl-phosphate synthase L chain, ATP binding domain-containing protein n=1 Tax=Ditylenchus destructor TaxID=166010 RepID=A0AAD4MID1_9BILA|nr:carbamoyl-phosphate synthase L chain, ATP binding domain-containing protein [Ditylenchus destructor]